MKTAIIMGVLCLAIIAACTTQAPQADNQELSDSDIQEAGLQELNDVDAALAELDSLDSELSDNELDSLDEELTFE